MLLETIERPITKSSPNLETSRATIAASAKVFEMFATQIYSDNYVAICRELVANAVDADPDRNPPQVTLPTALNPTFTVTDQGTGMSRSFMLNSYLAYTTSTKSNDNDQIGGFGIGSKAPFAYCDQFTIRTVHEGTLGLYSVYRDEEGIPCITELASTPTNEPSGTSVSFPVNPDDCLKFEEAASRALRFFDPLPQILSHPDLLQPPVYTSRTTDYGLPGSNPHPTVIMGGVAYPLKVNTYEFNEDQRALLEMNLDLYVPIGTFNVATSREQLSYNDTFTDTLANLLDKIYPDITASIPTMFDHLTKFEAIRERTNIVNRSGAYGRLVAKLTDFDNSIDVSGFHIAPRTSYRRRGGTQSCPPIKWDSSDHMLPQAADIIIIDDLPITPKSKTVQRIKTYVDEDLAISTRVFVTRTQDLAKLGNPDLSRIVYTSDLPEPISIPKARTPAGKPAFKAYQATYYGDQQTSLNPRRYSSPLEVVDPSCIPDEGVYVVMDKFQIDYKTWEKARALGFSYTDFFIVNKSEASKVSHWTNLEDLFTQKLAEYQAKNPHVAHRRALHNHYVKTLFDTLDSNPDLIPLLKPGTPLHTISTLSPPSYATNRFDQFIEPQLDPAQPDPTKLLDAFEKRQWKVAYVLNNHSPYSALPATALKLVKEFLK